MMVKLGENEVKTIEDLAGCATDDLLGWTERRGTETVRTPGYFDGFEVTREDAEAMVMEARRLAGWISDESEPAGEAV
jgi:N utilization substance protein A